MSEPLGSPVRSPLGSTSGSPLGSLSERIRPRVALGLVFRVALGLALGVAHAATVAAISNPWHVDGRIVTYRRFRLLFAPPIQPRVACSPLRWKERAAPRRAEKFSLCGVIIAPRESTPAPVTIVIMSGRFICPTREITAGVGKMNRIGSDTVVMLDVSYTSVLFPKLRRFVYHARRGAGGRTKLLYVTTGILY